MFVCLTKTFLLESLHIVLCRLSKQDVLACVLTIQYARIKKDPALHQTRDAHAVHTVIAVSLRLGVRTCVRWTRATAESRQCAPLRSTGESPTQFFFS